MAVVDGHPDVVNCTFVRNVADKTTGLGGGIRVAGGTSAVDVDNSILWANVSSGTTVQDQIFLVLAGNGDSTVDYSDVQDDAPIPGIGNLGKWPCFVSKTDLRLTGTSPCVSPCI
ncbi:MAG: hypothetical protein ACE5E6_04885, partial [Phycisphaerae bacterium]